MAEASIEEMSFETAMAELEQVVTQLERGDVALDASIALYERGAALKAHCEAKLKSAEEKWQPSPSTVTGNPLASHLWMPIKRRGAL